ncbi:MAG: S9 family peptidase [Planctomycetes bacterium]|nr:S9 family peptidase [Planctomycetota bacterium]
MPVPTACHLLPFLIALLAAACGSSPDAAPPAATPAQSGASRWQSPPTRKDDVVDDYHGTAIADPYRWLEDQDNRDVAAWVRTQNAATRTFLDAIPEQPLLRARLTELWNFPRHSVPTHRHGKWFYRYNDGLQNQAVLHVAEGADARGRVLLDPNRLSDDGTVALGAVAPSHDGELLAFSTSQSGSDWQEWRVLDVATGRVRDDLLRWTKFTGAAWTNDGQGFFYSRYPAPADGQVLGQQTRGAQLCYHRIGTAQQQDRVVYERPDQPDWGFDAEVSEDGRFLIVNIWSGSAGRNRIAYADLQQEGWPVQALLMAHDAGYDFLGNDGDTFWFKTDKDAPRGRIVGIARRDPTAAWTTLVPEQEHALEEVLVVGEHLVAHYLEDAASALRVFALDGTAAGAIELPDLGAVSGLSGRRQDADLHFTFQSFTHAPAVLAYGLTSRQTRVVRPSELRYDIAGLQTQRVFLQSRDGTRLCMFLVHQRGLRLDGRNPTYLFGYGGFQSAMTPGFSLPNLAWLERGGVFAMAVLRGGGEYGEAWHQAGMLGNKQNVFDDFIACAEFLIRNGWCTASRLGIGGGSNGGLLVGAVLTQRPDLIGAAVPEVGVLDMLRYHKFTIGWAWAPEYGSADDPVAFAWLRRYSPLHNVHVGTKYPPTLVMTGDHDDRVVPGHSFKFAAALQAAQAGPAPVLLRVETSAGHGAGKPTSKLIDEAADRLAFLLHTLRGEPR